MHDCEGGEKETALTFEEGALCQGRCGVDLVQSILGLPRGSTCVPVEGECVCVSVGMDAPRAVGNAGARGRGLREGSASPRLVASASLPPGVCATVLSGTRC